MAKIQYDENLVDSTLSQLSLSKNHLDNVVPGMTSALQLILGAQGAQYLNTQNLQAGLKIPEVGIQQIDQTIEFMKQKVEEILKYNQDIDEMGVGKRLFATAGHAIAKVGEGILTAGEQIIDGFASVIGWVGGLFSSKFKDKVGEFVKKDHVGGFFDTLYKGPLSGMVKASYMTDDGIAAKIFKGVGTAAGYAASIYLGGGAVGSLTGKGFAAGAKIASSSLAVGATTAGVGALGGTMQAGLKIGMDYNQAFKKGLVNGAVSAGTVVALNLLARRLFSNRAQKAKNSEGDLGIPVTDKKMTYQEAEHNLKMLDEMGFDPYTGYIDGDPLNADNLIAQQLWHDSAATVAMKIPYDANVFDKMNAGNWYQNAENAAKYYGDAFLVKGDKTAWNSFAENVYKIARVSAEGGATVVPVVTTFDKVIPIAPFTDPGTVPKTIPELGEIETPITEPPYVPPETEPPYVPPETEPPYVPPETEPPYVPPETEPPYVPPETEPPYVPPETEPPYVPPETEPPYVPPETEPITDPPKTEPITDPPETEPPITIPPITTPPVPTIPPTTPPVPTNPPTVPYIPPTSPYVPPGPGYVEIPHTGLDKSKSSIAFAIPAVGAAVGLATVVAKKVVGEKNESEDDEKSESNEENKGE